MTEWSQLRTFICQALTAYYVPDAALNALQTSTHLILSEHL